MQERYQERLTQASQPQPDGSAPEVNQDAIFFEAAGGIRKNHVFGLGTLGKGKFADSSSYHSTDTSHPPHQSQEVMSQLAQMQNRVDQVQEELRLQREEHERQMIEMRRQMEMMTQRCNPNYPPWAPGPGDGDDGSGFGLGCP